MPDFKKPRSNKFELRSGAGGGSRSPGHRGYKPDSTDGSTSRRADAAAPAKKRWTADDRAARSGDGAGRAASGRPAAGRPASGRPAAGRLVTGRSASGRPVTDRSSAGRAAGRADDRRPGWAPRENRPSYDDRQQSRGYQERPARSERPAYGDRDDRTERRSYDDRPQRSERPAYGDRPQRSERPSYNDRAERPSYSDRPQRSERPAHDDRPQRAERPSYNDRPQRSKRPSYNDRPQRAERPAYNDRPQRSERPSYENRPARTERPSYGDRPQRAERPSYSDRAQRDERPARRDSDYYPTREVRAASQHDDVVLERLEAQVITAGEVDGKTFGDLGIGDNITRQLATMGAEHPFPIQAATIPDVLAGRDVLGRGKTGSGKTIAFGAPLVERLMENNGGKGRKPGRTPRALILAPTRELAMQIDRTVQPIARSVGLFTTTIVGGVPQYKQVSALQRGVDIVIATPGRVEDLVEQGRLDLSQVKVTVLDEADHMCDLGFLEPVQRILRETADGGQKLLFSATLDKGVAQLVNEFLVKPAVHEVAGEDQASSDIDHRVLLIEQRDKRDIIRELSAGEGKTLIFARTRAFAEELADQLDDSGIPATSLHGDLNQSRRTRNLQLLTSGRVNVLVATDVAARGIHVDDISLVIQADAPDEYKTYLHRSGRTGRAGKKGTVVTLVSKSRKRRMDELLGRADIDADYAPARPGDGVLQELAAL